MQLSIHEVFTRLAFFKALFPLPQKLSLFAPPAILTYEAGERVLGNCRISSFLCIIYAINFGCLFNTNIIQASNSALSYVLACCALCNKRVCYSTSSLQKDVDKDWFSARIEYLRWLVERSRGSSRLVLQYLGLDWLYLEKATPVWSLKHVLEGAKASSC